MFDVQVVGDAALVRDARRCAFGLTISISPLQRDPRPTRNRTSALDHVLASSSGCRQISVLFIARHFVCDTCFDSALALAAPPRLLPRLPGLARSVTRHTASTVDVTLTQALGRASGELQQLSCSVWPCHYLLTPAELSCFCKLGMSEFWGFLCGERSAAASRPARVRAGNPMSYSSLQLRTAAWPSTVSCATNQFSVASHHHAAGLREPYMLPPKPSRAPPAKPKNPS